MTTALTLNIVLGVIVFAAVVGLAAWSIATSHRDLAATPTRRRRSRRETGRRPRTAPVREQVWSAS
jgi:hypothetical protein